MPTYLTARLDAVDPSTMTSSLCARRMPDLGRASRLMHCKPTGRDDPGQPRLPTAYARGDCVACDGSMHADRRTDDRHPDQPEERRRYNAEPDQGDGQHEEGEPLGR